MTTPQVRITSKKDGFRRAGVTHTGTTTYPQGTFTPEELEQLQNDPMLVVDILPEGGTPPPAVEDMAHLSALLEAAKAQLAATQAELASAQAALNTAREEARAAEDEAKAAAEEAATLRAALAETEEKAKAEAEEKAKGAGKGK